MNVFGRNAARKLLGFGGLAASAVLMVNQNDKSGWKLEYPEKNSQKDIVTRKIISPIDTSNLNIRLYQYQSCPYCCKVRTLLDYYGLSYEVVEVNPISRKQIKFSKDYRKLPIVTLQGAKTTQWNDSVFAASILRTFIAAPSKSLDEISSFYPHHRSVDAKGNLRLECPNKYFIMFQEELREIKSDIQEKREEREWREWVDNKFIHAISPNVYRTLRESLETFRYFSEVGEWERNFSPFERICAVYIGALAMYLIGKRLKTKHGIKDERQTIFQYCDDWTESIGSHRRFMGGNQPNMADLALFGALQSFTGCRTFVDILENTEIGVWFEAMQKEVNEHRGAKILADSLKIRQQK